MDALTLCFFRPSFSVAGGKYSSISSFICSKLWSKKTNWKYSFRTCIAYVQKHNPENKKEKCIEFIDATNSETCAAVKENIIRN